MGSHRSVKRRHVDLILVASAVCRQEGIAASIAVSALILDVALRGLLLLADPSRRG